MNRKEFLSSLGFSAAALALTSCLGGCEKDENNNTPAPTVDFTFDKTDPQYAALLNLGGYISEWCYHSTNHCRKYYCSITIMYTSRYCSSIPRWK